jgi:hypothetical protein
MLDASVHFSLNSVVITNTHSRERQANEKLHLKIHADFMVLHNTLDSIT